MSNVFQAGAALVKIGADIKDFKTKMGQVQDEMSNVQTSGEKMQIGLEAIAKGVIALGTAATAALGSMAYMSEDNENAFKKLQAQTGATTEEMEKFRESAVNIYRDAWGDSIEDVALTMAKVEQSFKGTGTDIEKTTQKALEFKTVFDEEVGDSVKAVSLLVKNFGVTAEEAYDVLSKTMQETGDPADDILDTYWEYSAQFKEMGFSLQEVQDILINGMNSGAWNSDKIGDYYKELNLRIREMNDGTREALTSLGLNADYVYSQMVKGGDSAKKTVNLITQQLGLIQDNAQAKLISATLAGGPAEDLGIEYFRKFNQSINETYDSVGTLQTAVDVMAEENLGWTITSWTRELKLMGAEIGEHIVPVLVDLFAALTKVAVAITNFLDQNPLIAKLIAGILALVSVLGVLMAGVLAINTVWGMWTTFIGIVKGLSLATQIATGIQWLFNAAMTANPIGIVVVAIGALIAGLIYLIEKTIGWKNVWEATVRFFKSGIQLVLDGLVAIGNFFIRDLPRAVLKFVDLITAPMRFFTDLIMAPIRLLGQFMGLNIPKMSDTTLSGMFYGGNGNVSITNNVNANSIDRGNINNITSQLGRNMATTAVGSF